MLLYILWLPHKVLIKRLSISQEGILSISSLVLSNSISVLSEVSVILFKIVLDFFGSLGVLGALGALGGLGSLGTLGVLGVLGVLGSLGASSHCIFNYNNITL
jgi:hypothetical protein